MGGPPANLDLHERIRRTGRPIILLRGPAACGKTAGALALYRDFVDGSLRPRCLLLAPNAGAVRYLRRRLLQESPGGVVVAPRVLTFAGLAGRVLAAAGSTSRSASPLQLQLLLRQIVDDLAAGGSLPSLRGVADTPGVVTALERAIGELKRAAFDPPALREALGRSPGRAGDLLAVYDRYQSELQRLDLHDVEGQAWLARDALAASAGQGGQGPCPGLEGVEALAVDGFTDFTPTQLEMLEHMGRRLGRVLITLCWDSDGRQRMWHWTTRTLEALRRHFGNLLEEIALPAPPAGSAGSLQAVWTNVFHLDLPPQPPPPGLDAIAACGRQSEVAAVAGRIKQLLLGGVRPGSIALLARSLEAYDPVIRRVFAQHDIPLGAAKTMLTDVGAVRFVLDVAAMAPACGFRSVLRVLKSSYLRPDRLGDFDDQTVAAAEMIVREGNVLEGYAAYGEAAARLAARARRKQDEDDEPFYLGAIACDEAAILRAGRLLQALLDLGRDVLAEPGLAPAPPAADKPAPAPGAAAEAAIRPQALVELISRLGLREVALDHGDDLLVARDLRALAALEEAAAELADWCGPNPPTLERTRQALSRVACPAERTESLVDVLDVLDARAVRYEHIFLLGLGEGKFPQKQAETSLIGEAERNAWRARGARLDCRSDLAAREMILFYLALSRAGKGLTLSYLEAEDTGSAGAPGPFLLAAAEPLGGLDACNLLRIPMGQFLPNHQPPTARSEAVLAATAGLFKPALTPHGQAALAWAGKHAPDSLERSARGLWARHRRWRPGEMDSFDGRLGDTLLLEHLRQRYAGAEVFSASGLNSFGQCPWQYFATYVLNLRPLSQPQRRLEAVTRGTFIHAVLQGVMVRLSERAGGGPVDLAGLEESHVQAALDHAFERASEDVELRRPPFPVLWRIQREQMRRELTDYLARIRQRGGMDFQPAHFELAFGMEGGAGPSDGQSRPQPVEIATPAGPLLLRGKIDRVDHVRLGGHEGLLVVDYKTGQLAKPPDILEGRSLQLPLYAQAARQILGLPCLGGVFHRVGQSKKLQEQYFARLRYSRNQFHEVEEYEEQLKTVLDRLGGFLTAMREGRFDVLPTDDCPGYCPFRQICHFSPARDEVKRPPERPAQPPAPPADASPAPGRAGPPGTSAKPRTRKRQ